MNCGKGRERKKSLFAAGNTMPMFNCSSDGLLGADPQTLAPVNAKALLPPNHATRTLTTSMFEVPLERCATSLSHEDSSSELPSTFLFYKSSIKHTFAQNNEDIAFKENGRWKLRTQSSLPMPQVLMPSPTALFFRAVEHVHVLSPKTSGPKGGWGMLMAVTVAVVALIAAAKQSLFTDLNQRKEPLCVTCGGCGLQKCYLCKGRGIVVWEGKLRHKDPCPLCFGTCHTKCSTCSGSRVWTVR